jgi:hypothetical protein
MDVTQILPLSQASVKPTPAPVTLAPAPPPAPVKEPVRPPAPNGANDSISDAAGAAADLKKARRRKNVSASHPIKLDRLPPHSPEAEQGVLGCALLSPGECLPVIISTLKSKLAFYDLRHQTIFDALAAMHSEGIGIDVITLQQRLKDNQLLEQIGGIAYLSQLQDAVPSAANLSYYLDIVTEKHELRRIVQTCTDVVGRIYDYEGHIDDLKFSVQSDLADIFGNASGGLPDIVDAADFLAKPQAMPPELVAGVLHRGSKLAFGGSSKAFKTWMLLDLSLSVAHGVDWMGFPTARGNVLFVNFEIQSHSWQKRIADVARAKGVELKPGAIQLWNLRGHAADFRFLIPRIIQRARREGFALIILDPIYKLYGGTDENAAGDVAALLNSLEWLAVETGAAVAYGCHFAKGNAAAKDAIDRISGSGVFARDPDSLLIFTRHEEPDAFTVDPILRNFPPVDPFVVRWQFPLMERDEELDPAKLKQAVGKKKEHDPVKLLAAIANNDEQNPISIPQWAERTGTARTTLNGYVTEMRRKGWVKTIGEGNRAKQAITNTGKAILDEHTTDGN